MLRIKSKKAWGMTEIFSGFAILLLTFVFIFVFAIIPLCSGPAEQKLKTESLRDLRMNYDLAAYLATPVQYEGAELTVAELITLAFTNPERKKELVNEEVFNMGEGATADTKIFYEGIKMYRQRDSGKPLTLATINFMTSYIDFIPTAIERYRYCTMAIDAIKYKEDGSYDDVVNLFATSYGGRCYNQQWGALAETTIPLPDEGDISVMIRAK